MVTNIDRRLDGLWSKMNILSGCSFWVQKTGAGGDKRKKDAKDAEWHLGTDTSSEEEEYNIIDDGNEISPSNN